MADVDTKSIDELARDFIEAARAEAEQWQRLADRLSPDPKTPKTTPAPVAQPRLRLVSDNQRQAA